MPAVWVKSARYGVENSWIDVTQVVNALLIHADGVPVSNQLGGDPLPGVPKLLRCELHDGRRVEYAEGETAFWEPIDVANLVYHVCPLLRGRKTWQDNIRLLRQYAHWVNGKRVISVVQGDGCDNLDSVLAEFGDFRIDKLVVRLNSELWEMATFPAAIQHVASLAANEAVFYAHAKGVSHQGDDLKAAMIWTRAMMVFLFGNRQKVLEKLGRYTTVGSFKESDGAFNANWHFSGTFFAIRNDRLFAQPNWRPVNMHRYFIEFYPATMFPAHEAFNLCPVPRPRSWLDYGQWRAVEAELAAAEERWLSAADGLD